MEDLNIWINTFEKNIQNYNIEFEEKTGWAIRQQDEITKEQLLDIIKWRYETKKIFFVRMLKLLKNLEDKEIREISRTAFSLSNDYYKLTLLCALEGVGPSISATILAFYNPQHYGILEQGVWQQIFPEKKPDLSIKGYISYLERLRKLSKQYNVPVRVLEQALLLKSQDSKEP